MRHSSLFPCGTELAGPDAAHHFRHSSFPPARCPGIVPRPHPANRRTRHGPSASPVSPFDAGLQSSGRALAPGLSEIRSWPPPMGSSEPSIHLIWHRLGAFRPWVHNTGHAHEEWHSVQTTSNKERAPRCISSNVETKVAWPGSWQRRSPRCAAIFAMSLRAGLLLGTGPPVPRVLAVPKVPFASHKLCRPRWEDTAGNSPRPRVLRLFARCLNPAA